MNESLPRVIDRFFLSASFLLGCAVAGDNAAAEDSATEPTQQVTAPESELLLIGDGFEFTEGPTADDQGNVYFTDQPNDRIVRYDFATNQLTDWLSPAGRSNGLFFVAPDRLIACADADNQLWSINVTDKSHQVLVNDDHGRRLNGPNDCWVDSGGEIYFTDPLYKRPYWTQTIPQDNPRGVYLVSDQGQLRRVADGLKQPNGIIGDAKSRRLYVADIGDKKTYRFTIAADGSLTNRTLLCESGSDGMTLDERGNVYLTGRDGVTVYSPEGKKIQTIGVPKGWTANVTFAGPGRDQLFITAGDSVYRIQMAVRGVQ